MEKAKKLYRSREHRMVSGVLGGLGEHFTVDPTILRIAFILFVVATGVFPGIIAYIVMVAIVPEAPLITPSAPVSDDDPAI